MLSEELEVIKASGGTIKLKGDLPQIFFYHPKLGENEICLLANMKTTFELYIYCSDISDQQMAILSKSEHLVCLGLYSCPCVTDSSVPCIIGMRALKKLALTDTGVSDKGLLRLKNTPGLIIP